MLKRASILLIALSLMSFLFTGQTNTASAHSLSPTQPSATQPTCIAHGCKYLDPHTESNCGSFKDDNSLSVPLYDSNQNRIGTLYNWYSPECQANWAAASLNYGYDGLRVEITAETDSYGESESNCWPTNCTSYQYGYSPESVYSSMVDGSGTVSAIGYTQYGPSNYLYR